MWDIEVDVACVGAGIGGLANAIATVDAGGEVLVADVTPRHVGDGSPVALRERVEAKRGWLVQESVDAETAEYFSAVSEGVGGSVDSMADPTVHLRAVRNLSQDEAYGPTVERFVGSRLNTWATQCLSSQFGLLYTSMRHWSTTSMRSSDGESIEVLSLGAMEWSDGLGKGALRRWMSAQARQRDIEVMSASPLERIVFEDGKIRGIVLATPDGPCAVRARAGVTFSALDQDADLDEGVDQTSGVSRQVCLVGRTASRFGRVELLDTVPAVAPRPTCTGSRKQFRDGLHDTRQLSLEGWRCGKVHGYPSLGQ